MIDKIYRIGQVARMVGVNYPVIKYAHLTHKLAEPALRSGQTRLYTEAEVQNVRAYFAKRKEAE